MIEYIILGTVILLQFGYIIYQDISSRKEREKLELKVMAKDIQEYRQATEDPVKDTPEKPDPYTPLEDVSIDKLLSAEDNL